MYPISFKRRWFPATAIVQAVRWYFRFTLSIRDLEGWWRSAGSRSARRLAKLQRRFVLFV